MKLRKGQAAVEFALMVPMFAIFMFGLIYGSIMFMDYLNASSAARIIARNVAVADKSTRAQLINDYNNSAESQEFTSFYNLTRKVYVTYEQKTVTNDDGSTSTADDTDKPIDAVVTFTFVRNNNDLPYILKKLNWPPEHPGLKIEYRMKVENNRSSSTTSTTDDNDNSEE